MDPALDVAGHRAVEGTRTYQVRRADRLDDLVRRLGTAVEALVDANGVQYLELIYASNTLTVPAGAPLPYSSDAGAAADPGAYERERSERPRQQLGRRVLSGGSGKPDDLA